MAEEGPGAVAGGGSGLMWAGGAAAGLAAGAAVWIFALGPMAPDAPAPRQPVLAEPADAAAQAGVPAKADTAEAAPAGAEAPPTATATAAAPDMPAAEPAPAGADTGATDEAAQEPSATPAPAAPATTDPVVPAFDTVRAETDGTLLVAGRAEPGQEVAVLADGQEVARATADIAGNFVAFATVPPSAAPRVLTLRGAAGSDAPVASDETVILAPTPAAEATPAPEAVAAAESATAGTEPVATATEPAAAPVSATEPALPPAAPAEPAAAPAAPLVVSSAGVRKLAAAAASGVVIDTITYGTLGQVQISGRGQAGSFARLYLDNAAVATAPVGSGGAWAAVLTDVLPGLYTLRVDQVDDAGSVTARFETPFKRETHEIVAAAAAPAEPEAPAAVAPAMVAPPTVATATENPAEPPAQSATAAAAPAPAASPAPDAIPEPATRATVVTVQPGFTLWRIATESYGDGLLYVKVFEANKDQIRDPDLIYPGQIFAVPAPAN